MLQKQPVDICKVTFIHLQRRVLKDVKHLASISYLKIHNFQPINALSLQKFSLYLKNSTNDPSTVVRILEKVDAHLKNQSRRFMLEDRLTRADCYLLPILQHIRVAGKVFQFTIASVQTDILFHLQKLQLRRQYGHNQLKIFI